MRLSSLLCLGWAPWIVPCYVFSGFLSWSGGVVSFAFVTSFVAKTPALPLLLGLRASLYRPNQCNGRLLYSVRAVRCYLVRFGCASSAMQAVPLLPQGVTGRSYRRPLSPSSSGCRCLGCVDSRPRNGLFRVLWGQFARATAPSLLCVELCCHPGGGTRVWLSLPSLQGYLGAAAPRFLAAFHRFHVVAVQALGCPGPVRLDIHYLRPGVWSLGQASAFVLLPSASSSWVVAVGGSCMSPRFEMLSVLFSGSIRWHFFGISRSFFSNVLIPSLPQLLASSCPGSFERVGGSAGLCLHPPASMASDPQKISG